MHQALIRVFVRARQVDNPRFATHLGIFFTKSLGSLLAALIVIECHQKSRSTFAQCIKHLPVSHTVTGNGFSTALIHRQRANISLDQKNRLAAVQPLGKTDRFSQSRRLTKSLALDRPISHILPLMVRQRNRSTQLAVHHLEGPGPLKRILRQSTRLQIWRKPYFLRFTEILHAAIGIKQEQTVNTVCVLGQSPVQLCHREQIGGKAAGKTFDALTGFVVRHGRVSVLMLGR